MATLTSRGKSRIIQFSLNGARRTIYLGKLDKKTAEMVRAHVTRLVAAKIIAVPPPDDTMRWITQLSDEMHEKLCRVALVDPRVCASQYTMIDVVDQYVSGRGDMKPASRYNLEFCGRTLVEFFGPKKDIREIDSACAAQWRDSLARVNSPATLTGRTKKARQIFADAVDRGLIEKNPFKKIKLGTMANPERLFYVPKEWVETIIGSIDDPQWMLMFAFARYAGLRTPSETQLIRPCDINWVDGTMFVRSPKTAHIKGKESRVVPITPELKNYLYPACLIARDAPSKPLITLRINPGTTARKIVRRAGFEPWPRIFQNLRASCETDWATDFPLHVACAWIGNTEAVAKKHYLGVLEKHISAATGAVRNESVGSFAEDCGSDWKEKEIKTPDIRSVAENQRKSMTPRGFEPLSPP